MAIKTLNSSWTVETPVSPYELSVVAMRLDPKMRAFLEKNYLDEDLPAAARRYAQSQEFSRVLSILEPYLVPGARVLDLGSGRGLTSLALAERGMNVTSIEMDSSDVVGIGALKNLNGGAPWRAIRGSILQMPFHSDSFDIAFCRSVLHHLFDLKQGLREIRRILKPGGLFLACNEHILALFSQGKTFLRAHPAVAFGVDENAYHALTYYRHFHGVGFGRIRFYGYPLDFSEFLEASRQNPLRAHLLALPVAGRVFARLLHWVHVVLRRYVLVLEQTLPAISIIAEKLPFYEQRQPY